MKKMSLLFLLFALLLPAGCGKKTEHEHHESDIKKIHLTSEVQQSIGLTVAKAEKKKMLTSIEVYGSIAQDTEKTSYVTAKAPGILKSFKVEVGETVDKGTLLAIVTGQNQEEEILSPIHGILMAQYIKEGEKVDNLSSIATIADPDILRASFDVYEKDIRFVSVGQKVQVKTVAYPGKEFPGKVVFVSPRVDDETRTIKIRVDVENNDHLLKFGMSVTGIIFRESEQEEITVPLQSVQAIDKSSVVFVKLDEENFEVREVQKASETDESVAIPSGLQEGEIVAVNGSFTLKSEAMKEELNEGGHDD